MSYLALDLGAGSGRAIVGTIQNGKIHLEEVYRFSNNPVQLNDTLYWNFLDLFTNIKQGISSAVKKGYAIEGLAVDTWGVDFGLIDGKGHILSNPVCYRDARTNGLPQIVEKLIPKEDMYAVTGIQQMQINTIYQLAGMQHSGDESLTSARKLLFTPDLINYFLTGVAANEYTIASTSQLLNAKSRHWDEGLFTCLNLPISIMQPIIYPCTLLGKLTADIAGETGLRDCKVFAIGSHDTASAIAAIPLQGEDWAFLSSGTWSLLGLLTKQPYLNIEALNNDFTNEGGVDGNILFMRNITGLWLLQRLIAEWETSEAVKYTYEELLQACAQSKPFKSIVNSDAPCFTYPASMSKAIQDYCKETDQEQPQTKGEFVRCVLESLALNYSFVMDKLQTGSGRNIKRLFIVGGGSQNNLLNQYIADSLGIEVITGLTEATAVGNIIQQAIADNRLKDMAEGHSIIKKSFTFNTFCPQNSDDWNKAKTKFRHLFS